MPPPSGGALLAAALGLATLVLGLLAAIQSGNGLAIAAAACALFAAVIGLLTLLQDVANRAARAPVTEEREPKVQRVQRIPRG
jgi:uncharacterized membrane protein YqgA involved in biofilm formation